MTTGLAAPLPKPRIGFLHLPFYYGWVNLFVAAIAMVGTLPGRTQGLGLITEPLLKDLHLDRVLFAQINLWATLLGSLFCLGFGRLLDQFGSRAVLTGLAVTLGAVVLGMSGVTTVVPLFVLITLTRGLGQSALSVASLTIVGQWFARRLNLAMGIYSVVMSIGFMTAFPLVGGIVLRSGWRVAWATIGWTLLLFLAPLGVWLVRRSPEACGLAVDGERGQAEPVLMERGGFTLGEALRTPAFWIFALASAMYLLVASGISLFNESILAERGFEATIFHQTLVVTALTALVGNFLGGWLTTRWPMNKLMSTTMLLLAGSLLILPRVRTLAHVMGYATVMGVAGGFVTVIFFTIWGKAFGRAHLGKIQGAAQTLTVIASAIGPLLLAACLKRTGSYASIFYFLAAIVAVLAVCAWLTPVPDHTRRRSEGMMWDMRKNR